MPGGFGSDEFTVFKFPEYSKVEQYTFNYSP